MKYKHVIISLLLILLSTSTIYSGENEIRYLTGYIKNVDDNLLTLANNFVWRADRHVNAMSMTPIVIVLQKDRNEGYLYINGKRVNVTLMQSTDNFGGKQLYTPALNDKLNTYNIGELTEIKRIDKQNGALHLTNGTTWNTKTDDDKSVINNWNEDAEVIVTKNTNTIIVTNVITADHASVQKADKSNTDKSAD